MRTTLSTLYDISFIILTWNSARYIECCVSSYSASIEKENLCAEFLIVDNGSQDNTINVIRNNVFPKLPNGFIGRLIALKKNFGTTISRNIALRKATGKYIIICDSDTVFKEGKWRDILNYLEEDKTIGIIAPCLAYPDGTIQNSVKKFPTLFDKISKLGKIFFNFSKGGSTDFYNNFPWTDIRYSDTAISAFWLFKKTILEDVGLFDEKIYYSPEDIDYCLRIWGVGKKILYYPNLKIIHYTQQISHRKPFSKQSISHFFGLLYLFKKHHYFLSRKRLKKRLNIV